MSVPVLIRESAPAKVNLFLHVLGREANGYHRLESLVAFADVADVVEVEAVQVSAQTFESESVIVTGPFAAALQSALAPGVRLSVEVAWELARAAAQPRRYSIDVTLQKNLPVAAGVGGGTADGAAALRALASAFDLGWTEEQTAAAALAIGADGPACAHSRPLMMRGIGEEIAPLPLWPDLDVVLVNPRKPVETRAVFAAFAEQGARFATPHPPPPSTLDRELALAYLASARNDLLAAAEAVEPAVAEAHEALAGQAGVRLVRLSGSGATVWAAFDDAESAAKAAESILAARPGWWAVATRLRGVR